MDFEPQFDGEARRKAIKAIEGVDQVLDENKTLKVLAEIKKTGKGEFVVPVDKLGQLIKVVARELVPSITVNEDPKLELLSDGYLKVEINAKAYILPMSMEILLSDRNGELWPENVMVPEVIEKIIRSKKKKSPGHMATDFFVGRREEPGKVVFKDLTRALVARELGEKVRLEGVFIGPADGQEKTDEWKGLRVKVEGKKEEEFAPWECSKENEEKLKELVALCKIEKAGPAINARIERTTRKLGILEKIKQDLLAQVWEDEGFKFMGVFEGRLYLEKIVGPELSRVTEMRGSDLYSSGKLAEMLARQVNYMTISWREDRLKSENYEAEQVDKLEPWECPISLMDRLRESRRKYEKYGGSKISDLQGLGAEYTALKIWDKVIKDVGVGLDLDRDEYVEKVFGEIKDMHADPVGSWDRSLAKKILSLAVEEAKNWGEKGRKESLTGENLTKVVEERWRMEEMWKTIPPEDYFKTEGRRNFHEVWGEGIPRYFDTFLEGSVQKKPNRWNMAGNVWIHLAGKQKPEEINPKWNDQIAGIANRVISGLKPDFDMEAGVEEITRIITYQLGEVRENIRKYAFMVLTVVAAERSGKADKELIRVAKTALLLEPGEAGEGAEFLKRASEKTVGEKFAPWVCPEVLKGKMGEVIKTKDVYLYGVEAGRVFLKDFRELGIVDKVVKDVESGVCDDPQYAEGGEFSKLKYASKVFGVFDEGNTEGDLSIPFVLTSAGYVLTEIVGMAKFWINKDRGSKKAKEEFIEALEKRWGGSKMEGEMTQHFRHDENRKPFGVEHIDKFVDAALENKPDAQDHAIKHWEVLTGKKFSEGVWGPFLTGLDRIVKELDVERDFEGSKTKVFEELKRLGANPEIALKHGELVVMVLKVSGEDPSNHVAKLLKMAVLPNVS